MRNKKAVCLLSGGLDSTTALYVAMEDRYTPLALTIDYGQLHSKEIECARRVAGHLKIEHKVISIPLPWGGSSLIDRKISMPEGRSLQEMSHGIPNTYVPARNTIFLSVAASYAEAKGAEAVYIGANALDYSGYPDCRGEFFEAFSNLLKQGTKCGTEGKSIEIKTPLIQMKKSEIIQAARRLNVPLEWTWSCYKGGEFPCGVCDSCLLREKGFQEAGLQDPLIRSSTSLRAKRSNLSLEIASATSGTLPRNDDSRERS